jgi:hypothetical protein
LEEKLEALEGENKKLKESAKEKEERTKSLLVSLKEKLIEAKRESNRQASELKALQDSAAPGSMAAKIKNLRSGNNYHFLKIAAWLSGIASYSGKDYLRFGFRQGVRFFIEKIFTIIIRLIGT